MAEFMNVLLTPTIKWPLILFMATLFLLLISIYTISFAHADPIDDKKDYQETSNWYSGHWWYGSHHDGAGWWWITPGGGWFIYSQPVYPYPDPPFPVPLPAVVLVPQIVSPPILVSAPYIPTGEQ